MDMENDKTAGNHSPDEKIYPRIYQVSALFSVVVFVILFAAIRFRPENMVTGLVVTQAIVLLLPVILMIVFRLNASRTLRLNPIDPGNAALVFVMMPFAMFTVGLVNAAYLLIIKLLFGRVEIVQPPIPTDIPSFALMLLVVGAAAGICEEVLFRGIIMRGFERLGIVAAIAVSSILFGMMHFDFQKIASTSLLGVIIAIVVYRTNSLYAGMIAHFANNATAMTLGFLLKRIEAFSSIQQGGAEHVPDMDLSQIAGLSPTSLVTGIIIFVIFALVFFVLPFAGLFTAFIINTRKIKKENIGAKGENPFPGILWLVPGLAIIGVTYLLIAMKLMGVNADVLSQAIKSFILR